MQLQIKMAERKFPSTRLRRSRSKGFLRDLVAEHKLSSDDLIQPIFVSEQKEYQVDSEVWSVTSFNELRKNGMEVERLNLLNPAETNKKSYVEECLGKQQGPILTATDYMRINADQIRPFTKKSFYSLGTDGYGRSDTRKNLRNFFEVDKEHIVAYSLSVLANEQLVASKYAENAIKKYKIDKNKPMPTKM